MSKAFKEFWEKKNFAGTTLSKSDKQQIDKQIFKNAMEKKESSPWAICTSSVGRESSKYEDCVTDVKGKLGVHKDMTEDEYNKSSTTDEELIDIANTVDREEQHEGAHKDVGIGYAGPTPKSGLGAQDLEVDTQTTTKPEEDISAEKEDPSGPLPNRVNF